MIRILKLLGGVLAGFSTILGVIFAVAFFVGMIVDRSADLLPLLKISIVMILVGLALFKILGFKIRQGLAAAFENLPWFM
jgi:hypothetical protein